MFSPISSVTPSNGLNSSLKPSPAAASAGSAPATVPSAQSSLGTVKPPSVTGTVNTALAVITSLQGSVGAFQSNTLQTNAAFLPTPINNATSANAMAQDTDYASEIANFTRQQIQLQAGATALSLSNSTTPPLIAKLLGHAA